MAEEEREREEAEERAEGRGRGARRAARVQPRLRAEARQAEAGRTRTRTATRPSQHGRRSLTPVMTPTYPSTSPPSLSTCQKPRVCPHSTPLLSRLARCFSFFHAALALRAVCYGRSNGYLHKIRHHP
eukprot:335602-Rhodomonas_salina.1